MAESIDLAADLRGFFSSALQTALHHQHCATSTATEQYVVGLLVDHLAQTPPSEGPLGLRLLEAQQAPPRERFERLRTLGDEALYALGFFRARLGRGGLSERYFAEIGATAYWSASGLLGVGAGPDPFAELAAKFTPVAQVLEEVAEGCRARAGHSPQDLVRTYERWLRTGSAPLAEALALHGVTPQRNRGGLH